MKPLVKLIHWNVAEAKIRARQLQAGGFTVDARLPAAPVLLRELRRKPPAAVVISLDRLPSQGRDVAFVLRSQPSTRNVPLVFVGGTPDKVAGVRARLPDAAFTTWEEVGAAIGSALARPCPAASGPPAGAMAGYSGTPLPTKLGIKAGMSVALLGASQDVDQTLGTLPVSVRLAERAGSDTGLALWFVRSRREFECGLTQAVRLAARLPVWVVSPKKSGPLVADLSQNDIREALLARGLVDYKVCAVDSTWSGLLFRRRRKPSDKLSP